MIELGIVDLSAESRRRVTALVERWAWTTPDTRLSLPRISVHSLSPEEVRFHGALDVCVIGPELIGCDAAYVSTIRAQLPDKILLAVLDSRSYSFGLVEQLGRMGIDDVLVDSATSDEFFRRILLLQKRIQAHSRGRLIVVDSARGGVGRTWMAAAIAEGWYSKGSSVCVVDCDVVSQDLTRFLQVRPYVSEPLKLVVDQQRVVTSETASDCIRPIWDDEPRFVCMPPPSGGDESVWAGVAAQRAMVSVLETLVLKYDVVVVDTSGLLTVARNALLQVCDEVIFVINRDTSAAYANRQGLSFVAGLLRHDAQLSVLINDTGVGAAPISLLRDQVTLISGRKVSHVVIPRCARAMAWVCSGYTPYRFLSRNVRALLVPLDRPCPSDGGFVVGLSEPIREGLRRVRAWGSLRLRKGLSRDVPHSAGVERRALPGRALLALSPSIPEGEELVSKPVVLG